MNVLSLPQRVYNLLRRQLKAPWVHFAELPDPRDRRGRRWPLRALLQTLLAGLLAGEKTMRAIEDRSRELALPGFSLLRRRLPDTTLYDLLPRLDVPSLLGTLLAQVKTLWRQKQLVPVGLPCGVVAIDGKSLGSLEHHADGWGQRNVRSHDGSPYWLVRALRTVLTSSVGKTALWQYVIPADTNEMGCFVAMFDVLREHYDALFEIITVDAGMTSQAHAVHVHAAGKGYVMAVKESQPSLLRELKRVLLPMTSAAPIAQSDWERVKKHVVQRRLYRSVELAGLPGWESLRQAWLVRTVYRDSDGRETTEDRYFISNVHVGRLTVAQILRVVREHWSIESDCNWTFDLMLREDARPMCTQGTATLALGVLRLVAYNLLQLRRRKHLRPSSPDDHSDSPQRCWRQVFAAFADALTAQKKPLTTVP